MKIVADENIPLVHKFFGDVGSVETYPGRALTPEMVADADVLLIRSVTNVNEALLAGSRVKFVGTCTIGCDHVDLAYLKRNDIYFASAPGSNANSVVEYVLSCLSVLTELKGLDLGNVTVGVVGCGNVGGRLADKLKKLGIKTLCNDPLLDQADKVPLNDILACDIISLHTPLTKEGEYPTYHLFDEAVLARLTDKQVLINTGRGAVIDGAALKEKIKKQPDFTAILDVWETEPDVDQVLARLVTIGTPHIAGYSFDGKVAGTEMIYCALCRFFGLPIRHKAGQFMPEPPLAKMAFTSQADLNWSMHTAIRACYDVRHDHSALLATLNGDQTARCDAFDLLRKNYRSRREFTGVKVLLKNTDAIVHSAFKTLGFSVKNK